MSQKIATNYQNNADVKAIIIQLIEDCYCVYSSMENLDEFCNEWVPRFHVNYNVLQEW